MFWRGVCTGYMKQQSTKPDTLGYALNDSPAGLLAWIVEKFWAWSDKGLLPYSKDFLITNACLYWLTGNVSSSLRIYYEAANTGDITDILMKQYCKVSPHLLAERSCLLKVSDCLCLMPCWGVYLLELMTVSSRAFSCCQWQAHLQRLQFMPLVSDPFAGKSNMLHHFL